jgi:hypothetical protein
MAPGSNDCDYFVGPDGDVRASYCFERLIFVEPKKIIPFTINVKESYQPGDIVDFDVTIAIPEDQKENFEFGDEY